MFIDKTIYRSRPSDKRIPKEERCYDLLERLGVQFERIDHEAIATVEGCDELVQRTIEVANQKERPRGLDLCQGEVHRAVHSIAHIIEEELKKTGLPARYAATKVVEGDPITLGKLQLSDSEKGIVEKIVTEMEHNLGTDREAALADMRYEFIANACKDAVKKNGNSREMQRSIRIDNVLTNKYLGI
ncbi:MAG: hypothetical protein ACI4T6_02810, partial [Candidatus Flemingiibacterium sp.]